MKARSISAPLLGQRRLVGGADALGRELGVGDDDRLHARGHGRVDDGEDLVAREVPGGEHEVVARDHVDDLQQLGERVAVRVDDGDGAGVDARRAQVELEAHPYRHVAVGVGVLDLADLVLGADGGEPHDARALAGGDLDRGGVEAADRVVERDRAERRDARHGGGDDRGALGGGGVVRLQPEAGEAELEAALGQLEVGDPARGEVGRDVDVRVEPAADELPRALGGDRVIRHRTSIINTIVDNLR